MFSMFTARGLVHEFVGSLGLVGDQGRSGPIGASWASVRDRERLAGRRLAVGTH